MYSEKSAQTARRLAEQTGTDEEKVYTMMLLAALLMDLCPEDREVEETVLKWHGEHEVSA